MNDELQQSQYRYSSNGGFSGNRAGNHLQHME